MKTFTRMLMLFTVISAITFTSCSKDDKPSEPDMTTKVSGEYQGTYKEGEGGSFITIDEIDATITKVSSSEIKVIIEVFPGLASAEFNATMDTDTTFTVPEFQLNDERLQGEGSIQNENSLNITLEGVSSADYQITYIAERK